MHPILLKSVNLFDPEPKGVCDLFLCGGIVAAVGKGLSPSCLLYTSPSPRDCS